jgi:hypothetical protein
MRRRLFLMARQPGFDPAASHNSRQMKKSTQVALGGLSSALCLLLMFMTGLIPFSSYIFPALAGIVLISVREENGLKTALLVYAATSLLALLIIPDREAVMMYILLLGYYPLAKPWIERLARPLSILFKLLLFNIVVVAFYYVMLFVFGVPDMLEGWGDFGRYTVAVILVIVNFTLFMYDYLLTQALHIYRGWFRPKILRKII